MLPPLPPKDRSAKARRRSPGPHRCGPQCLREFSAPADPPHLNNTITINLNELMESGDATNNVILQAGDIRYRPSLGNCLPSWSGEQARWFCPGK